MRVKELNITYIAMEKERLNRQKNNLLIVTLISFILLGCSSAFNQEYVSKTLGLNIKIEKKIFNSEDAINPQGEGFSLEVFTYDKNIKDIFINMNVFPKTNELRKDWKIALWQKTPFQNKNVLNLLFNYKIDDLKLKEQLKTIDKLLKSDDNYISYFYKDNNGEIYAADICILDIKSGKIYLCEIIT